jgi:hypothetical protein
VEFRQRNKTFRQFKARAKSNKFFPAYLLNYFLSLFLRSPSVSFRFPPFCFVYPSF